MRQHARVLCGWLVLGMVAYSSAIAATDVPAGPVSGSWNPAGSPYRILGDISVSAGETLTLAPGTEVSFTGFFRLTVEGQLAAIGTAADTIVIGGTVAWDRIRLENASETSRFTCCRITGAERGLHAVDAPAEILHCRLGDHVTAIEIYGIGNPAPPAVTVRDCRIHDCQRYGIFVVENSATRIDSCEITRCALDGSPRGAIQLSNQSAGIGNDPEILDNWIHHNVWQGITAFDITGAGRIRPAIERNTIEYNLTGVYLLHASGELRHNQINHNFEAGNPNSGAGVMVSGASAHPVLTENTLTGNFTGLYIVEGATANLGDLGNPDPTDDGRNHIYENVDPTSHTWSVYSLSTADVKAENNTWDSTDYAVIAETIYDGNDNPAYGIVDFDPLLDAAAVPPGAWEAETGGRLACRPNPSPGGAPVCLFLTGVDLALARAAGAPAAYLRILAPDGRCVRTLASSSGSSPAVRFTWDGRDGQGRRLPAGVYLGRLSGSPETTPARILRLR